MTFWRLKGKLLVLVAIYIVGDNYVGGQTANTIAKNIFPSVVMIEAQLEDGISQGSGFFVKPDVIATNYHVIKGAKSAKVKIVGKPKLYSVVSFTAIDQANDLALLKISDYKGTPLILANLSKIDVGQDIYVLGNPQGLEGTISTGIISSKTLRQMGRENLIQITAPISPGSSGGPVVNKSGHVIGVASASLKSGQNLNFAVPSTYLANLLLKGGINPSWLTESDNGENTASGPTLEESTSWLSYYLSGRSSYKDGVYRKIDSVRFNGCLMQYDYKYTYNNTDYFFKTEVASFANIEKVGVYTEPDDVVFLNFREGTVSAFNEDKKSQISEIAISVGDASLTQKAGKAFLRLQYLCSSKPKKDLF